MNKFDLLYEQILEEMNRRDFLKTLGKGAKVVAGNKLMPGGIVGTALKGAINVAAGAPPIDINKAIFRAAEFSYNLGDNMQIEKIVPMLRNSFVTVFNGLKQLNLTSKDLQDDYAKIIDELDLDKIKQYIKDGEYRDLDDWFVSFTENGADQDYVHSFLDIAFKNNLLSLSNIKKLENDCGIYKIDYATPEEQARQAEEDIKKEEEWQKEYDKYRHQLVQQYIAKDIDYTRMDKAGSSEDEGYAKYYAESRRKNLTRI